MLGALLASYFVFIDMLVLNTPQADDFIDTLFFLQLYYEKKNLFEKISQLFWQYNEHTQAVNKIITLLFFKILGRIDFFLLFIVGALLLPLHALLIKKISTIKPESDFALCPLPSVLCSLFFVLCPSQFLYCLTAGYASIIIPSVSLPILLVLLIHKQKIIFSSIAVFFMVFTMTYGILMIPLTAILTWKHENISRKSKIFLSAAQLTALSLYFFVHINLDPFQAHTARDYIEYSLQKPLTIFFGTLGLLGSLSHMEGDSFWLAILPGATLILLTSGLIFHLWKKNDNALYSTLCLCIFFIVCAGACSITRVATFGLSVISDSHYKIYSLTLWAIVISGIYTHSSSKFIRVLLVFFSGFVFFIACIRYINPIIDDIRNKQELITQWTISGNQPSLGYTAILPYSHEALLASVQKKYYSPFDSKRGALDQPLKINTIETCKEAGLSDTLQATITNNLQAIAFSITPKTTPIKEVMLCNDHHNFTIKSADPTKRIVVDKSKFPSGIYKIILKSTDDTLSAHSSTLDLSGIQQQPCNMNYLGYRLLAVAPVIYDLLCSQAKAQPFHR